MDNSQNIQKTVCVVQVHCENAGLISMINVHCFPVVLCVPRGIRAASLMIR